MAVFAVEVKNPRQAEALFAFLKTLDSVTVDEIITSETASSSENLTEERKMELDRRIKSLGNEKTYSAEEAFSYARKKIIEKN